MRRALIVAALGTLFVTSQAFADNASPPPPAPAPAPAAPAPAASASGAKYGTAGCGLGSLIFGDKPGIIQIFAATTNGTSGNQTFAITTGTSNCEDTGSGSASAKIFIQANREALVKDMARGGGETVKNLATIAGCGDAAAVGAALQRNFTAIVPNASTPTEKMSDSILSTLKNDKTLACTSVGS